jgi:hypothetical protein
MPMETGVLKEKRKRWLEIKQQIQQTWAESESDLLMSRDRVLKTTFFPVDEEFIMYKNAR